MVDVLSNLIIPSISSAVAAAITWFFARKKLAQETKASELENVEKAIEIWREMAQNLELKMKHMEAEMQHKIDSLTKEIHAYRKENQELKSTLNEQNI